MNNRLIVYANFAIFIALAAWGIFLLSKARSKADYLVARVHQDIPLCQPVTPSDERLASLGLRHEPGHSWSDRAQSYIAFSTPALPQGGVLTVGVAATAAKHVSFGMLHGKQRVQAKGSGVYKLLLAPSQVPRVNTLVLDSSGMAPPHGDDRRWLGVAVTYINVCGGPP